MDYDWLYVLLFLGASISNFHLTNRYRNTMPRYWYVTHEVLGILCGVMGGWIAGQIMFA